jgi:hypothetical protein
MTAATLAPLPKRTDALLGLLRGNPALRAQLVDAGLTAWRHANRCGASFSWRGRRFRISATNFRYLVRDGSGRALVCRWH